MISYKYLSYLISVAGPQTLDPQSANDTVCITSENFPASTRHRLRPQVVRDRPPNNQPHLER